MFFNENDEGMKWMTPSWVSRDVGALFTLRHGGVSEPPFSSLNLGLHVHDEESRVLHNRNLLANVCERTADELTFCEQIHGSVVTVVTESRRGSGMQMASTALPGADAMVTNVVHTPLVILAADCVPVLFYDPVGRALGAAHSGWKGTVSHISVNVIETMKEEFNSRAEDLRVALGPSIAQCCYEVDKRLTDCFLAEFPAPVLRMNSGNSDHAFLSLQACIREDLVRAGVAPENIEDAAWCTGCHTDSVYSHRMEHGQTGRHAGVIWLT